MTADDRDASRSVENCRVAFNSALYSVLMTKTVMEEDPNHGPRRKKHLPSSPPEEQPRLAHGSLAVVTLTTFLDTAFLNRNIPLNVI